MGRTHGTVMAEDVTSAGDVVPENTEERQEALAAYRQAAAEHNLVLREKEQLRRSAEAHLMMFNEAASIPIIEQTLRNGDQFCTLRIFQDPLQGVGGLLWPSGQVLAELISCGRFDDIFIPDDKNTIVSVCELGCGVAAIPSFATAGKFKCQVIATDTEDILSLAEETMKSNSVLSFFKGSLSFLPLSWGESDGCGTIPEVSVVLAADIIYAERNFKEIIATLQWLLKPSGGVLLLSFAKRSSVLEDLFFFMIESIGIFSSVVDQRCCGNHIIVTARCTRRVISESSNGIYL